MPGPRITIVGAAGFTNLGDDAILAAMLGELREVAAGATFQVTSGDPGREPESADVTPIPFDDAAIDAAIAQSDLLIVGGGGFIYDHDMRITARDFLHGDRGHIYPYYRAALTARTYRVPCSFYAVGVGPLLTAAGRTLTRDILSLADAITVRDAYSLHELRACGLTNPVPELTADPAVGLRPVVAQDPAPRTGRAVGFVARPWLRFGEGWSASGADYYERYVSWLAAAADHLVERWDAIPVLLAAQRRNDPDHEVAEQVIARMRHGARAHFRDDVRDYRELQRTMGGLDALVSTRLHPLILGAVAGVPSIGIALMPKVRSFLARLGLHEFAVSPWRARTADLTTLLDRALRDPAPLRRRTLAGIEQQRQLAARNPRIAAGLLTQPTTAGW